MLNINPLLDFYFIVADNTTTRALQGNIRNGWEAGSETFMESPHVATAALEEPIRQAWSMTLRNITGNVPWGSTGFDNATSDFRTRRYPNADIRTVQVETQIAVIRTVCIPTQNLSSSDSLFPFPVLPEYDFWYVHQEDSLGSGVGAYGNGPALPYGLPTPIGSLWLDAMNSTDGSIALTSTWVSLPDEFGSATTGLALLFPPKADRAGMAISCTIDARWAQGQNWVTASVAAWDKSISLEPMQARPSHLRPPPASDIYPDPRLFAPTDDGTWRRIYATPEYLDALTPPIDDHSNQTTLESILLRSINTWYPGYYQFSNFNSLRRARCIDCGG
jgi:hypothetical protein